jgi:hypothetical protein
MVEAVLRIVVCLALVFVLTAGATQINQDGLMHYLGDLCSLPTNFARAQKAREYSIDLATQREAIAVRIEQKEQIAREVMEGRLPLRQAADRLYEVSKASPYDWDIYRDEHPDWSMQVRCAYLVIDEVEAILRDQQQEPSPVTAPLRKEVATW